VVGEVQPTCDAHNRKHTIERMGYPADWIERQLAHAEQNSVRRAYKHADYLTDRAKMMQRWADTLDSWRDGATVVSLRSAVA
jgi:integrase